MQTIYRFLIHFFILSTLLMNSINADTLIGSQAILDSADDADWRTPEDKNLLYMQHAKGQVIFELAPAFAPEVIANIRQLVTQGYFDGLAIIRVQDNYVVQWGDSLAGKDGARSLGEAKTELEPEFFRERAGLDIVPLDSRDAYAEEVGFVDGFPVASDGKRAWLTHCYGMLGVGRDYAFNSGNGAELYVVTGHAPRHLDRNVTLIGRVIAGVETLSSLPRGTGFLGFYEDEKEHVRISSIRFGDDISETERVSLQVLRTDSRTFQDYVQSRTHRKESWFADPAGRIEICNVQIPVKELE